MTVREWTIKDLDGIAAIEAECFSDPWSRRMLADSFLSENFFGLVLEEEGTLVGYGGIGFACDEAELELIAVSEMYRRCGRGQALLSALLAEAKRRDIRRMFLEVRVSNAPAQMLYLKNGFRGLYARSRYYADGEDAIVMKKELD